MNLQTPGAASNKRSKPSVASGHLATSANRGCENERHAKGERLTRGRPRLDTMDRTAADRRRTQIRLAQRAYRHRKETAFSALEQRIDELEVAHRRLGENIRELHELLKVGGVLDIIPYAACLLTSLTTTVATVAAAGAESAGNSPLAPSCLSEPADLCSTGYEISRATPECCSTGRRQLVSLPEVPYSQPDRPNTMSAVELTILSGSTNNELVGQSTLPNEYSFRGSMEMVGTIGTGYSSYVPPTSPMSSALSESHHSSNLECYHLQDSYWTIYPQPAAHR